MNVSLPRLAWVCLLLGSLAAPVSNIRFLEWVMLGDPFFLAAGVLLSLHAWRHRTQVWLPWWWLVAGALMALGPAVSLLPTGVIPPPEIYYALCMSLALFVVPWVIASLAPVTQSQVTWLLVALVGGTLIQALIAVLQSRGLEPGWITDWLRASGPRVGAMTYNPGMLGCYVAMMVPICLAQALDSKSWLQFGALAAATGLLLYAADLTGSRAAIAAAVLAAFLTVAITSTRWKVSILGTRFIRIALLAIAAIVLWAWRPAFDESAVERLRGPSDSATHSDVERARLREDAMEAFWDKPVLGNGYRIAYVAHNMVIGVLRAGGITGFLGFALLHIGYARYVVRLFRLARSGHVGYGLGVGMLGMLFAWLLLGIGATPLLDRVPYVGFGLAILACQRFREGERSRRKPFAAGAERSRMPA